MGWKAELETLKTTDPTAAKVAEHLIQIRRSGEYSSYDAMKEVFGKELAKLLLANDQFDRMYNEDSHWRDVI